VQNKELQEQYRQQIPDVLAQLENAAENWKNSPNKEAFGLLFTKVSDISGSAEMFGQLSIGAVAKSLQAEMSPFFKSEQLPNTLKNQRILGIIKQLTSMLQQPTDDQNTDIREVLFKPKIFDNELMHILLIEHDSKLAQDISQKLTSTNFEVTVINDIAKLRPSLRLNTCCIIANLDDLNSKEMETLGKVEEVRCSLPLIFLSRDNSIGTRLKAVQAGGQSFIIKPLDYTLLLQSIDSLTERALVEKFRVLIIDDQKSLSDYYASILESAGFEVMTVNNPQHGLMPALTDFVPDLILLDLYMPYCNGQDLAGIIRQMDNLLSVPIIFLSAEASSNLQLRAMSTGADAFLTKPVSSDDLLLTVQSRIKRGRALRDLVTKDHLSSLLNRRESIRRLDEEISRSRRTGTHLSVAMLDLDHFKKINDSEGHSIGDWVIKFFSRSMQKVFRDCDIIGRHGGEEFLVIFPDTEPDTAQLACKRLKKYIKDSESDLPIAFTYSGGLALLSNEDTSHSILERADIALYKAKEKGRNKVITATDNKAY
jgi:diguanylate cyclase (GGDEF)-like protein|tara:strand:- start:4115 stop:5731 length:1617 start_codon:yes stop_codon:yes gene_type:complete